MNLLETAINNNDVNSFRINMKNHIINNDMKNKLYQTALMQNRVGIVKSLITEFDAGVNTLLKGERTPLWLACDYGYFEIIKLLCDHGANIHSFSDGTTNLSIFLGYHQLLNIELLVQHDGSFETVKYIFDTYYDKHPELDFGKNTILAYVATEKIFFYLMQKGATVSLYNAAQVLNTRCMLYDTKLSTIQLIIDKIIELGGNVEKHINYHDSAGNVALHHIYDCKNAAQIIQLLMRHGANINLKNNNNDTPIINICRYRLDLIDIFLENKAEVMFSDRSVLFNVMHNEHFTNQYHILDKLISHNIDVNAKYKFLKDLPKLSILFYACMSLNVNMVKYFIKKGANLRAYSENYNMINFMKYYYKNPDSDINLLKIFKILEKNKCNMNNTPKNMLPPLINAINDKWPLKVISIIIKNSNINVIDEKGLNALYFVCEALNLPLIKLLVKTHVSLHKFMWNSLISYNWIYKKYDLLYKIIKYLYRKYPKAFTDKIKKNLIQKLHPVVTLILLDAREISNICKKCKCQSNILYNGKCSNCIKNKMFFRKKIISSIEIY